MNPNVYTFYLFIGVALVTIIDAAGSIASRRFNFNYGYFAFLSFIAYVYIAGLISNKTGYWTITLVSVLLIGFYDATVGWQISRKLNANYGQFEEQVTKITITQRLSASIVFSIICAGMGVYVAENL